MSESRERISQEQVLEEFEFEGRPAAVVQLQAGDGDIFKEDLKLHALNLARNQEEENKPGSDTEVKTIIHRLGEKLRKMPLIGSIVNRDRAALTKRIEAVGERRLESIQGMIREGKDKRGNETEFVGVYLDGRIVSIVGVRTREKLANGRQIYELTAGSTLLDLDPDRQPKYAKQGFSKKLMKTLFDKKMAEDPEAVWMGDSKNIHVIGSWQNSGWEVIDIDDKKSEIASIFKQRNAEYLEMYTQGGYKIGYADPKVQTLRW